MLRIRAVFGLCVPIYDGHLHFCVLSFMLSTLYVKLITLIAQRANSKSIKWKGSSHFASGQELPLSPLRDATPTGVPCLSRGHLCPQTIRLSVCLSAYKSLKITPTASRCEAHLHPNIILDFFIAPFSEILIFESCFKHLRTSRR